MKEQQSPPSLPERKDMRLKSWDYANSACYHVTICTAGRARIFGRVVDAPSAHVKLSSLGKLCARYLGETVESTMGVSVLAYIIMPNHMHILVQIAGESNANLGAFVRSFKARVTRGARDIMPQIKVWQRGYYDHVIRDECDLESVWEYIENNPAKWVEDQYYQ